MHVISYSDCGRIITNLFSSRIQFKIVSENPLKQFLSVDSHGQTLSWLFFYYKKLTEHLLHRQISGRQFCSNVSLMTLIKQRILWTVLQMNECYTNYNRAIMMISYIQQIICRLYLTFTLLIQHHHFSPNPLFKEQQFSFFSRNALRDFQILHEKP